MIFSWHNEQILGLSSYIVTFWTRTNNCDNSIAIFGLESSLNTASCWDAHHITRKCGQRVHGHKLTRGAHELRSYWPRVLSPGLSLVEVALRPRLTETGQGAGSDWAGVRFGYRYQTSEMSSFLDLVIIYFLLLNFFIKIIRFSKEQWRKN